MLIHNIMPKYIKKYQFFPLFFQRFLQTLRAFFVSYKGKTCPKLLGRIHSLQRGAEEVKKQLKGIVAELQSKDEKEYSSLVTQVINPMLREVNQFEGDGKSIKRMEEWTKKGRHWMQLYSKNQGSTKMTEAVAGHTIENSFKRIDRDLVFIETYVQHRLDEMRLHPKALMQLKKKIEQNLTPCLTRLLSLKALPQKKTLFQLEKWKVGLDEQRAKQINRAIQLIDNIL